MNGGLILLTYKKFIRSGDVIEVYEYAHAPTNVYELMQEEKDRLLRAGYYAMLNNDEFMAKLYYGEYVDRFNPELIKLRKELGLDFKQDRKEQRLSQTIRDARNQCRRLALMNFDKRSSFITLTVAENSDDIDFYDKKFKAFIRKLRLDYGEFSYLAVREFQKRGAIHYHVLIDYPFIKSFNENKIRELEIDFAKNYWYQGFVDIKDISHVDNVGAYVVKYMTSELHDKRLIGRKSYLCSRGLKRSEVIKGDIHLDIEDLIKGKKEVFQNSYVSEYQGTITYKEFNLFR